MFCGFPLCTSETTASPSLFVTRENNKVIKSVWGVFGCGWTLDTVLLRLWFPVLALSSLPLTYCFSKAFSLMTVQSAVQYKTSLIPLQSQDIMKYIHKSNRSFCNKGLTFIILAVFIGYDDVFHSQTQLLRCRFSIYCILMLLICLSGAQLKHVLHLQLVFYITNIWKERLWSCILQ